MLSRSRNYLKNAPDFRQVRAVTGHHLRRSFEKHFAGRPIRRTLLLRDPISFHLSYYNHRMMFLLARGGQPCSFDQHIRAQGRDLIALILLWYWFELPLPTILRTSDARKYELLNEALAGFWFVGSYHDCDRLLAVVAADLDMPPSAPRRNTTLEWQRRVGWTPLQADDLTPSMRDLILSRNPIHDALWHNWQHAGFETAALKPSNFQGNATGGIGFKDLMRAVLADRVIPPIWQKAVRASKARDWPRAVALYRKALARSPRLPDIWLQYGHALKESGDLAAAEAAYRRAIGVDAEFAEGHFFLGQLLARQGRAAEAREAYLRFEKLDPAALHHKIDELVALGWQKDAVLTLWRSVTDDRGPG
jgi:tetratricopeptide (TPR) repeat protein